MKERQRWRSEEDDILQAYVKQYGAREWSLVPQRMNVPLDRDAKSCLERWKNYLKPGIKRGSLTEEEQRLVIRLQAKHGNKWKKIAAEIPGRTAKRLGKWWEVHKEKQQRSAQRESSRALASSLEPRKYDHLLENFAEKLVKERRQTVPLASAAAAAAAMANPLLPPWLSNNNGTSRRPQSPSVVLTLSSSSSSSSAAAALANHLQNERGGTDNGFRLASSQHLNIIPTAAAAVGGSIIAELAECCRDVEEGHRAWMLHKKEAAWRLKRVELQLESEKACKRRAKMDEIEAKMRALREEQQAAMERIEAEYREQLVGLRRDAEANEQKLGEQWAAEHTRLTKFLEQVGWCSPAEMNRRCR